MKKFGLSKKERIKSKKEFGLIYSNGNVLLSDDKKLKAVYFVLRKNNESGIKVAFAVSHKAGNAVWRNRMKRLLREAFRNNKYILEEKINESNLLIYIVFSPNLINQKNHKKIYLNRMLTSFINLMNKIKSKI